MLITIKATAGSSSFNSAAKEGMTKYNEEIIDGKASLRSLGTYKRNRLPNSDQIERPIVWSYSKKKWLLKDYDYNSDDLNEIVKSCGFLNEKEGHPDRGRMITTCDINNLQDPFFNHKALVLRLKEGDGLINTDNRLENLLYKGALVNHKYQVSGDKINPAISGRAKYIIVNKDIDTISKRDSIDNEIKCITLFQNLTAEKRLSIAMAMGIIKYEGSDPELVASVLFENIKDNTKLIPEYGNRTKSGYFIYLCESDTEELNILQTVEKAISKGVIKKTKGGFEAYGEVIGKDKREVQVYLKKPINSEILIRVQDAIKQLELND